MHVQMCKLVLREEEAPGLFIGNMLSLTLACCMLHCLCKQSNDNSVSVSHREGIDNDWGAGGDPC